MRGAGTAPWILEAERRGADYVEEFIWGRQHEESDEYEFEEDDQYDYDQ